MPLELPRTSARLGQSAAWATLAGHIGLVFHAGTMVEEDDWLRGAWPIVPPVRWTTHANPNPSPKRDRSPNPTPDPNQVRWTTCKP